MVTSLSFTAPLPSSSTFLYPSPPSSHLRSLQLYSSSLPSFSISLSSERSKFRNQRCRASIINKIEPDPEAQEDSVGVKAALSMLNFYKREISPLMPKSCRYVPTCSEYSMIAYKKYGVVKGSVLTAWRLCRCNPLGGSGFDPPRWFGEERAPEE